MAKIDILAPYILSWEGGFVNDPADRGGATNKGVTIETWKRQGYDKNKDGIIDVKDLKLITERDATEIMRKNYWDRWQADFIKSQSIANILVDWVWGSGVHGIKIPQAMLGLAPDGLVGAKTIEALNKQDALMFFNKLKAKRKEFLQNICKARPSQYRFLNGWLRRLDGIRYGALKYNNGKEIHF